MSILTDLINCTRCVIISYHQAQPFRLNDSDYEETPKGKKSTLFSHLGEKLEDVANTMYLATFSK